MRMRVESYDFRKMKADAMEIVDRAGKNDKFSESDVQALESIIAPVMMMNDDDAKVFETVLEYMKKDDVERVRDILFIYFDMYIKARP
jgi:hypothetical protein